MAITALTLIEDALRDLNVISEVDNASAEQGAYGLRKLNQLMEAWKESSIDLDYFALSSTNENVPIPDWAELGVTAGLSIAIAPKYGASISPELAAVAAANISMIKRKLISEELDNADMSHLPRGTGWWRNRYNIETDGS